MKYPEDLLEQMYQADDDDMSDGAWQAMIEGAVNDYNRANKTKFDSFEAWLWYIESKWRGNRLEQHRESLKKKK